MFSAIRVLRNYNPTARAISLSSAACRCITTISPPSSVAANDSELLEGVYTASLNGIAPAVRVTTAVAPEFAAIGVVGSGACYKCGREGHWAKDCSVSSLVSGNEVAKECACGAGSCVVRIANTERNRGRKFYRCPVRQENGGCGFFEWCDESAGDNASGQERAQESGLQQDVYQTPSIRPDNKSYGVKTGSPCFKCGGEGHWARDCPTIISSGTATGVRDKPSSNVCYKCGQPGHWAKDCSQSQTTTGVPYH